MSIGLRLREERTRIGLSQPAFAALAGASKGAQQNWEKDAASPNATALVAFAEAGADVLYILTGRRTADRPQASIEDTLTMMRQDILSPSIDEEKMLPDFTHHLQYMLSEHGSAMTPELREEAASLLEIVSSPQRASAYRAADFAQMKKRREEARHDLSAMLTAPYRPGPAVLQSMAALAIDHAVPTARLALLAEDIHADITGRKD